MIYYDKISERLVAVKKEAKPEFWDEHWQSSNFIKKVIGAKNASGSHDKRLKYYTTKYLFPGAKIIDAGCGRGRYVYGFDCWGYDSYGVDTASITIDLIKMNFPKLKVDLQDIRNLEFTNNYFDCYYSGGVIEHYWHGYTDIINEIYRVLKPNGILIVTFPFFSPIRRLKAKLGCFPRLTTDIKPNNFYQFYLNHRKVINNFKQNGFKFIEMEPYNEILGITSEFPNLGKMIEKRKLEHNFSYMILNFIITKILRNFVSHSLLLIFRKNDY